MGEQKILLKYDFQEESYRYKAGLSFLRKREDMMFSRKIYLDEYTAKHFFSLRRKIRNKHFPSGIYVITLSKTSGRVEFYDCNALKQKYYKQTKNYPLIIGLAKDYDSAQNMVIQLLEETYREKGNADIKTYLKEKIDRITDSGYKNYDITIYAQKSEE